MVWKKSVVRNAIRDESTTSIFGRRRTLPFITHASPRYRYKSERAGINHMIQGSAADIVMLAMLRIYRDAELRRLGYKLILQIHDEVIMEGPAEHGAAALERVKTCMSNPFPQAGKRGGRGFAFRTALDVDGKTGETWYDCK